MCRLFAYVGDFRDLSPYLAAPERSLRALAREHSDGWGIARTSGGKPAVVKALGRANEDHRYLEQAQWTRSSIVLAHVRKASEGLDVSEANTHPFSHGPFAFAHNGTLRGLDAASHARLAATLPDVLRASLRGTTDSEIAFLLVLREVLARHRTLSVSLEQAAAAMAEVARRLLAEFPGEGKPSEANFVLVGAHGVVATRLGKPLVSRHDAKSAMIASEPLGRDTDWVEVPEGSLVKLPATGGLSVTPIAALSAAPSLPQ